MVEEQNGYEGEDSAEAEGYTDDANNDAISETGSPAGNEVTMSGDSKPHSLEIPDGPEGYDVAEVAIPDSILELMGKHKVVDFDRQRFAEIVHEVGLTKDQARKLWSLYTTDAIMKTEQKIQEMREEQEKRAQEMPDNASQEREIAHLEDLKAGAIHLTPAEAQILIDKYSSDMNGPLMNPNAPALEHEWAVARQNRLYEIVNGHATELDSAYTNMLNEREERRRVLSDNMITGSGDMGRSSRSGSFAPDNVHSTYTERPGFAGKKVKSGFGQRIEDAFNDTE